MDCNYNAPCPYEEQCADCLHKAGRDRKYKATGIDTSDMTVYKREYMRMARESALQAELRRLGLDK